jgi:hypothetical protein
MDRVDYESTVVQDLYNLFKAEELDLNPWYQRRSVWLRPQKAYLINSLFESKPIPTIYIRHYLDIESERSIKEVVDGQQRLRAMFEYLDDSFAARHPAHKKRVKFSGLTPTQRATFKMAKVAVGYLIAADDADVIDIFGRLNSVAKTLNAQERRNAAFSGEMKQFCLKEAASRVQFWRDTAVFTANDIARMNEVQFISDLVLNLLSGLSDFSASKLDDLYCTFDDSFDERDDIQTRLESAFTLLAGLDVAAIRDTVFCRQPLFFSLFLVLDGAHAKIGRRRLAEALFEMDTLFSDDVPLESLPKGDSSFVTACTSSTQRIKSRRIRDRYIKKKLGLD